MTKRVVLSLAMIALVIAGVTSATIAYFSDTAISSGNTFTAGTLDLTLGESGGAPISLTSMQPGDTASGIFTVTNTGSLAGWLGAKSSYVEADGTANDPDMSADNTANMLLVTAFTDNTVNMLGTITDVDSDGRITIYDMVNDPNTIPPPHAGGSWYSYDTDMQPSEIHIYSLTIKFDEGAGNDYQGDGITWTFEFLLDQK